jgi:hypothetical protein
VIQSALADEAGVLGAVALAMDHAGLDPFSPDGRIKASYPLVSLNTAGNVMVDDREFPGDVMVRVDGGARPRKRKNPDDALARVGQVKAKHIAKTCQGGPEVLFVAANEGCESDLTIEAESFLDNRRIDRIVLPVSECCDAFNSATMRRAMLVLTGR